MIPSSAPEDEPLEQGAEAPVATDPALAAWFLADGERGNPASGLRLYSCDNQVTPLVDGADYFRRLADELAQTAEGDQIYFLDFRGDLDERLDGPGTEVGHLLSGAAARGVLVYGLLWRSQPRFMKQSEEANAEFVRHIADHGGQVMLDARTRRGGSHHQKLVVIRHPDRPDADIAFVGGIDLGRSRRDDHRHDGDSQVMDFPTPYGPRPAWHDIQAEVRGPAVHDLEHTFRERWYGSSVVDVPSPVRQLFDRAYHASAMTGVPLPEALPENPKSRGSQAVQVLRTYPARLRRYPFAPLGERSIARSYRRAIPRARRLVYLEDQYLWFVSQMGVTRSLRGWMLVGWTRPAWKGWRCHGVRSLVTRRSGCGGTGFEGRYRRADSGSGASTRLTGRTGTGSPFQCCGWPPRGTAAWTVSRSCRRMRGRWWQVATTT